MDRVKFRIGCAVDHKHCGTSLKLIELGVNVVNIVNVYRIVRGFEGVRTPMCRRGATFAGYRKLQKELN